MRKAFLERKTHREDWYGDGEASAKERFPLPPDKVSSVAWSGCAGRMNRGVTKDALVYKRNDSRYRRTRCYFWVLFPPRPPAIFGWSFWSVTW